MLQAQSSCAREWYISPEPEKPRTRIRVKRTVYKVNHRRKLIIKGAALVISYAFLLVFLCIKSATLGYQIGNLEQQVKDLETANNRLDYQISEKTSLGRVEWVAVTQLGMSKADQKTSLALEVKAEPLQVAAASASNSQGSTVSQKLWDMMYSSFAHLAQNE